jgi:NAD(P)-dependent dehydrogenase (short-subunit alcohol dehydrogenase family)
MSLREKTVIVTGAGQSIGRAIAIAFSKENYNVVLSDIDYVKAGNVANEINGMGGESLAVKCDVTKKEETDDLVLKSLSRYKKIDALVYGTEISTPKPFMEISITDWEEMINLNLRGALLVSQATAKEMKGGGKIIFVSSIASSVAWNGMAHYSATKGGLESMMRVMALEFAPKKINVNAVLPGVVDAPEMDITIKNEAENNMITTSPDRRIGKPEDIAGAVVFLASEGANYINGQTITVDGGYTIR